MVRTSAPARRRPQKYEAPSRRLCVPVSSLTRTPRLTEAAFVCGPKAVPISFKMH